jgi:hypothetical protein
MGIEKSGVGAASILRRQAVVPSEGLGLGDLRTKPISMMGTERQQTVQSHVSGVQASRVHLRVTNRPPNLPSLGTGAAKTLRRNMHGSTALPGGSNKAGFPQNDVRELGF